MPELIYALAGLVVGVVVVWLLMRSRVGGPAEGVVIELRNQLNAREAELKEVRQELTGEQRARVAAQTQLEEARRSLDEQKKRLDEAVARLTDTFKALSQEVLRSNSQEFLDRAKESLGKVLSDTKGDMGVLVNPLRDALKRYEEQIHDIETKRVDAYSGLSANLTELSNASASLQQQTTKLEQALRAPGIRGKWGELMLERVLEISGLTAPVIEPQPTVDAEEGQLRPDVIVRLPDNRSIIVDSKAPMNAYMDAMAAENPETRNRKLQEHAAAVRGHMKKLAQRGYAKQVETSTDMVVMFLPGESFLAAALDADKALLEDSIRSHIALATPTTLIMALHTVAHTWRQHDLAENAEEIAKAGSQLYDRLCVFAEHLDGVREGIDKAAKSYNDAVGSWQARVEPGARELKKLGAAKADQELPGLEPTDTSLRQLPPAQEPDAPAG